MSDSKEENSIDKAGDADGNRQQKENETGSDPAINNSLGSSQSSGNTSTQPYINSANAYTDNEHNNNQDQRTSTPQQTANDEPSVKVVSFSIQLMDMVTNEVNSSRSAVEWVYDGSGFVITNQTVFEDDIIPRYFSQSSFQSFLRRLYR